MQNFHIHISNLLKSNYDACNYCFKRRIAVNENSKVSFTLKLRCFVPYLGTNFKEWLNIQKREPFPPGPSPMNSCPKPLPHLPQLT